MLRQLSLSSSMSAQIQPPNSRSETNNPNRNKPLFQISEVLGHDEPRVDTGANHKAEESEVRQGQKTTQRTQPGCHQIALRLPDTVP